MLTYRGLGAYIQEVHLYLLRRTFSALQVTVAITMKATGNLTFGR